MVAKSFSAGDQVWLFSLAVPRGKTRKLHHPWTGPWLVVRKLSDAVYRIKALTGRRKQLVVHFDRLKLCPENTCITAPCQPTVIEQSTTATQARPPLSDLEIIDEPEPEPDPLPPYQHRYLLQYLYLLLNRRLLLLNQS